FLDCGNDGAFHPDGRLYHTVNVTVVIEQWSGGQLLEHRILSHDLRPSELVGAHISLVHHPLKWPRNLDLSNDKDAPARMKGLIQSQDQWAPVLKAGTELIAESGFNAAGEVMTDPFAPLLGGGA